MNFEEKCVIMKKVYYFSRLYSVIKMSETKQNQCDFCANYYYDNEADTYICTVSMDEDDYARFYSHKHSSCPYFNLYDEYKIVRKQN